MAARGETERALAGSARRGSAANSFRFIELKERETSACEASRERGMNFLALRGGK